MTLMKYIIADSTAKNGCDVFVGQVTRVGSLELESLKRVSKAQGRIHE